MGTRGFVGFVVDGTEKIAYNHSDSYPDGLGLDMLRWASANRHSLTCDIHRGASGGPVAQARALRVVANGSKPTPADIEQLGRFANLGVGTQSIEDWYVLLRETQGDPKGMLAAGVIEDASGFPADSLFAEWGYVIDLDANVFEVYEGFQKAAHEKGRFAARSDSDDSRRDGYWPVALVASWPLDALPGEDAFMKAVGSDDSDEG